MSSDTTWEERLAGWLIVRSARRRLKRGAPNDAHEVRHLRAAILAGDSSECGLDLDPCRDRPRR